ncbi:hypothetical protein [Duganella levis]|uniref:Uncharacterized protein n=1 Tax=Duganella levis TaxID=2692169 RepID=A0ABW9W462_9BURK|nr:hypothetical protein [Duganella levis]MYN28787.1 hypothetical protein [Duganella levis]
MSEFPAQKGAIAELVSYFETAAKGSARPKLYDFNRISAIANLPPDRHLVLLLHRLVQSGLLEQFIRVEYNFAGIGDFPTIEDVPDEIYDARSNATVVITPDKLRLYYRLYPRVAHAS